MIRSTLLTFTKQTMGRVRRRISTKQRSMTLVVRSFLQRCHLAGGNPAQERFPHQQRQLVGAPLKLFQHFRGDLQGEVQRAAKKLFDLLAQRHAIALQGPPRWHSPGVGFVLPATGPPPACCLNRDQIERYELPPNPAKTKDPRFKGYVRKHGTTSSWELDALEPEVIEDIIEKGIRDVMDEDLRMSLIAKQEAERNRLKRISHHWPDVRRSSWSRCWCAISFPAAGVCASASRV